MSLWTNFLNWLRRKPAAPAPAPSPTLIPPVITYPTIDADGCIKPSAFAGTPLAPYRIMVQDTLNQPGLSDAVKLNLGYNFNYNFGIRIATMNSDPFYIGNITPGFNYMVPRLEPSNNAPQYSDVLVFPRSNPADGYPGLTLGDCATLVAKCTASGKWPTLVHATNGVV